ncbi:MAG: EAL domain-containing protein [Actinomycetota bacterium]
MPLTRRRHLEAELASQPTDLYSEFLAGWDRLEIHGQEIRSTSTTEIYATEALVRWRRGPGELWAAGMALPIAEETGVIEDCTQLALDMSIAAWAGSNRRDGSQRLALNLHRASLESSTVVSVLLASCATYGVAPSELVFEIPDRLGAQRCRAAVDALGPLFDAGARIALDDHRGEASETTPNLSWLPVGSLVKLDAAITDVCDHPLGRQVLERTAGALHQQGYEVAAEMIERPAQLDAVRACNIGWAQGHLLGAPQLFS